MALKALLHNKTFASCIAVFLLLTGCSGNKDQTQSTGFQKLDISGIPNRVVAGTNPELQSENGVFFFKRKAFSGFITEYYENQTLKSKGSYLDGKQYGITRTYYPDGSKRDERSYKNNIGYGRHVGFWENGKRKFDFFYVNDKQEGRQRQWYPNGQIYLCLYLKNDSENGMQRGWRTNGKLFANYEVKDGIRYGLQKANLCYTLRNEKVRVQ